MWNRQQAKIQFFFGIKRKNARLSAKKFCSRNKRKQREKADKENRRKRRNQRADNRGADIRKSAIQLYLRKNTDQTSLARLVPGESPPSCGRRRAEEGKARKERRAGKAKQPDTIYTLVERERRKTKCPVYGCLLKNGEAETSRQTNAEKERRRRERRKGGARLLTEAIFKR